VRVAQDWFADLAHAWSAATDAPTTELPQLSRADLPRIRNLRETLTRVLRRDEATGATAALATTSVRLELTPDGTAHLAPGGSAAQWLTGVVLGEILRAQAAGAWRRLKVCRNVACSGAFYDLSKNNSRVWHDVHRCGNIANLRASRARRRAGGTLLAPPKA
jgi:predicted RNA-binding Zn ribbon-like protein